MIKKILIGLFLVGVSANALDYRREVRLRFENKGFEHVSFNHERWGMFKKDSVDKRTKYKHSTFIRVTDNCYTIEKLWVDCKGRKTNAYVQIESCNNGPEKTYIVDEGFSGFGYMTLQEYVYKLTCERN